MQSTKDSLSLKLLAKRPRLTWALAGGMKRFNERLKVLRRTLEDPESYLRDEYEIIGEPTARHRLQLVS